jgi:hypothetical protein
VASISAVHHALKFAIECNFVLASELAAWLNTWQVCWPPGRARFCYARKHFCLSRELQREALARLACKLIPIRLAEYQYYETFTCSRCWQC